MKITPTTSEKDCIKNNTTPVTTMPPQQQQQEPLIATTTTTSSNNSALVVPSSLRSVLRNARRRLPVRRALTELGRNDKSENNRLFNSIITQSTSAFKRKYNFDPEAMTAIEDGASPPRYAWEKIWGGEEEKQAYEENTVAPDPCTTGGTRHK